MSARGEMQLHAFMGRRKSERLVETPGVRPGLVGRQLHEMAAAAARAPDRMLEHHLSEAGRAVPCGYAHALDQRAPAALVGETRNESDLQHADNVAVRAGHDDFVVRIGGYRIERG